METIVRSQTVEDVYNELFNHGYMEVEPPGWLDLVMTRKTHHELVHLVAGVLDVVEEKAELPAVEEFCQRFEKWSQPLRGINGRAILIFAYPAPSTAVVKSVLEAGKEWFDCPILRVVYDVQRKTYWYWQAMQGILSSHKAPA